MPKKINLLMSGASEIDANMYYATRFIAPDPFIFIQIRGKKHVLMSDLEVDRAKKQSSVDQVHSISDWAKKYHEATGNAPTYTELIVYFAQKHRADTFVVPADFSVSYADRLRHKGLKIIPKPNPFFEERTVKAPYEVRAIQSAIRQVEKATELAIRVLKSTVIKKGKLYLHGQVFTSEALRKIIDMKLLELGLIAQHTIVSCGKHSVDPHDEGSGPLYAHQPIIMDIFPRDTKSRYFADFTRTIVRGKASEKLKKMYRAVWEAQKIAFKHIRHGADGHAIHGKILTHFEKLGFKTGFINGRMQGFFHGTGHGLGLDIHEAPSVGGREQTLKTGQVVTVEPGLYYEDSGGIRLEDVVVVTQTGCRNLTKFPKFLEI